MDTEVTPALPPTPGLQFRHSNVFRLRPMEGGFVIDEVVSDNGVSGVTSRLVERPEGRRSMTSCAPGTSSWCAGSTG